MRACCLLGCVLTVDAGRNPGNAYSAIRRLVFSISQPCQVSDDCQVHFYIDFIGDYADSGTEFTHSIGRRATDPFPGMLLHVKAPLLFFIMPCTTARPNPDPLPCSFVVKYGSKILVMVSAVMPDPVSLMEISR